LKKHTKIYFKYFGYDVSDFIACEICGSEAVDIHHIDCRGMGGTEKDDIENLMAVCRRCHELKGDKKQYMNELIEIHKRNMFN
jgi:5-methylcytosine-specific restriction endonuclease McrA